MSAQFRSRTFYVTVLLTFASLATLSACAGDPREPTAIGTDAPVIVPRSPGAPARTAEPGERIAGPSEAPTAADVRFVEGMIPHHRQALEMTAMVAGRTDNPGILRVAEQIALTQEPEIKVMATWLTALGRRIPDAHGHRSAAGGGATPGRDGTASGLTGGNGGTDATPESEAGASPGSSGGATGAGDGAISGAGEDGMASPQELDALRASRGAAFDRMFLRLMIRHHEGALKMADDVLRHGRDQRIRMLAREVYSGQNLEIARMRSIRVTG
ncbi:DUF305 domain-containing protein [Nonomuraea longicatena]|uniref:DUF305 domain-containing protein n=1 Tax=Nonomuraea longicatena TaxID=83682 RepID=A0ABN1PT66_9ACTN